MKQENSNKQENNGKIFGIKRYMKDHPVKSAIFGTLFALGIAAIGTAIFFSGGLLAVPIAGGVAAGVASGGFAALFGGASAVSAGVAVGGAAVAAGSAMAAGESYRREKSKVNRQWLGLKARADDYGINVTDMHHLRNDLRNFDTKNVKAEEEFSKLVDKVRSQINNDLSKITNNQKVSEELREQDQSFYEKYIMRSMLNKLNRIRKKLGMGLSPQSTAFIEKGLYGKKASTHALQHMVHVDEATVLKQKVEIHETKPILADEPTLNTHQPKYSL
jgi:hypothetical protein